MRPLAQGVATEQGEEGEGVQLDRELTSNALEGTAMAGEAGRRLDGARMAASIRASPR